MPLHGDYTPSAMPYARDHVALYESTGGREGNLQHGRPVVILTTRGARSGAVRKTPVMRVEHDGTYAAVASMNGAPSHPSWYHNIVADPQVMIQDGEHPRDMTARIASGDEKDLWWQRAVAAYPDYETYQANTDRDIPVVLIEPVSAADRSAGSGR